MIRRFATACSAWWSVLRGRSVLVNCDLVGVTPHYPTVDGERLRLVGDK